MSIREQTEYIERYLKIKTKDNKIIPFELNEPQKKLMEVIARQESEGKPLRIIILKARQMGFSTLTEALIFHRTAMYFNVDSLIVAHREDSAKNLFLMSKLYYDELPELAKPMLKASTAYELRFENPIKDAAEKQREPGLRSRIRCVTAGGKGIGRSFTLKNAHISEYAFWEGDKKATLAALLQAVPNHPDTMVIIESTANGFDDFKELWDAAERGESDFEPVFFGWHEMREYRMPAVPGTEWTPEELALKAAYDLDDEQLMWRRWCIKNNCGGDERMFRQEYPASADEAFLTTGTGVFDNEQITRLRQSAAQPIKKGWFEYDYDGLKICNIRWTENKTGFIHVYEDPKAGHPYVLGGDTAGEGSDYFTGQVLDNTTGKQVCKLRNKYGEAEYARQMYCLGMHYNTALIGIEANYSTYPVMELERLRYPKQFVRQSEDDFTHRIKHSFGFMTTRITRPIIIAELVKIMRESPELAADYDTLGEMLTFVYNEHRRPEAMEGEHDDLVMSLAIAHYIRSQQTVYVTPPPTAKVKWSKSMWEDYNRASREDRKRLIQEWGVPER